ncbi:MAG TPA: hypothetical protein RMH85_13450 [Polyangiaceae bacterium LLY-WYZ-15_(1-7)]|nr:hypothetical protein [Myxococcales bacterium]MAT27782.1 hypothetical protein [Sandaracinus sp.]HJK94835.1 hypothetical protein [Polyangiaceae bacterium LLY-WYZ-15_(1-7)]MBJ75107.1 hypothetical protein [Sandaracinus sp.]HJL00102.1 hypothetical protein [Polyangiaceae bacterium LLY-WYZ-15_(1-7)]
MVRFGSEKIAWVASCALALALACGGDEGGEEPPSEETSGAEQATTTTEPSEPAAAHTVRPRDPEEIPRAPKPWEEMTAQEKGQFMGDEVLPYMRALFQEYDAERYADFGCATCHGADMNARGFAMPNQDILALHPSGSPEQRQMVEAHPEMVRFMFNHVLPAMRDMIGAEPYDAETGEGFSCYTCHPHAE